jgi:hypothetical protein
MRIVLMFLKTHDREIVFFAGAVFGISLWYISIWITFLIDEHRRRRRMMSGKGEEK